MSTMSTVGRADRRRVALGLLAWPAGLTMLIPAFGQYAVSQDGRLFDANTSLSDGRYNYAVPATPFGFGNPVASGNVRYGLALRVNSPIDSPFGFRASLGSGSLSNFLRDSVSVADRPLGSSPYGPVGFYDPARTAPTAGFLQGHTEFPLAPARRARGAAGGGFVTPRADARMPGLLNYSGFRPPADPRSEYIGPSNPIAERNVLPTGMELSASIFGLPRAGVPDADGGVELTPNPLAKIADPTDFSFDSSIDPTRSLDAAATAAPLDMRIRPQGVTAGPTVIPDSPLAGVLRNDSAALLHGAAVDAAIGRSSPVGALTGTGIQPATPPTAPSDVPTDPAARAAAELGVTAAALRDRSMLPGADAFNDLQLALALSEEPEAEWYDDMRASAEQAPAGVNGERLEVPVAEEFLDEMLNRPLRSFRGELKSPMNDLIADAEAALSSGKYADAARTFGRATQIDPRNPLPWVGRAHAELGGGDYLLAAMDLTRGLERFPELARFGLDLKAMLGGGETVDIRRADIMELLKAGEDARLRFLLGYLEYHSGMKESGLANLKQAAESAEFDSIIRRYPALLERQGTLPPRLNLDAPTPDDNATEKP